MDQSLYKRYAEIKEQKKILEAEETLIKNKILPEIEKNGKQEFEFGKFSRAVKRIYTYSEDVQNMADDLKEAQLDEVEQGIAEVKESPYIMFKTK